MSESIEQLATIMGDKLKLLEWKIVTAESCTGGRLAGSITSIPGSSNWFDRGFITYSNSSKAEMLGVKLATLEQYGAVSEQVACEMALGALRNSQAQLSVITTGIAGPDGGSKEKPVGTVWIAWLNINGESSAKLYTFPGDREHIRTLTIKAALENIIQFI